MRSVRWAACAGIAAMVAISAWQRWQILDASPFPVGVDGYYYAIQVRSLLEHGRLAYPAAPLAFWWIAPFAAATDPITGAKLAAAIGGALIAVPAYWLGRRLGRGSTGAGLVAAALATSSAGSAYLSLEFVKQSIGITVALAAVAATWRAVDDRRTRSAALAVAGWLATLLAHKLAFALLVVLGAPALVRAPRRLLIYAVLAIAGVVLAGLAMPRRVPSLADAALLRHLFAAPRWSAPALVTPTGGLAFRHEALAAGIACVAAAIALRRRCDPRGWAVVALGVFVALPWLAVADPLALGFRLRIAAFVPMALGAAIASGALPAAPADRRRDSALAVAAAALFALGCARPLTEGESVMHPKLAAAIARAAGRIPPGATVIVPELRMLYPAQWYTRAPVSLRPERVPPAQRVRLFGQAFAGGAGSPLDRALAAAMREPSIAPPVQLYADIPNGVVLVTEPTWAWLLAHVPPGARAHFTAWPTM